MTDVQSETGAPPGAGDQTVADAGTGTGPAPALVGDEERHIAERAARIASRSKPTRIVAARVSIWLRLGELWRARELFFFLVRKEIKVKYKNSALGFLWSMLNPALTLAVFYVLFTFFLPNGIPNFVIYMFSAMLVWNLFQTAVLTGTSTIVSNAAIVKKVAFPREILALSTVGAQVFYFSMSAVAMAIILVVLHATPDWGIVWLLIPAMAALLVLASGICVLLSALNVKLRDMRHLIEVLTQLWFWLTPIVYPYEKLAPHLHWLKWFYLSNPMTPIVLTFQRVLYPHLVVTSTNHPLKPPTYLPVLPVWSTNTYAELDGIILAASVVLLVFAVWVFGRLEGNFAEEL